MLSKIKDSIFILSGSWLLFEQAVRVIISTIYIFLLASYLGPSEFGQFIYILLIIGFIKGIVNFGLEDVLVKFLGTNNKLSYEYIFTSFQIKTFINSFIFLLLALLNFFYYQNNFYLFSILVLTGFNFFSNFDVISSFYESRVEGKSIAICKLAQLFLVTIFKIYILFYEYDLIYFIIAYGLELLFLGIFYLISFRSYLKEFFKIPFNPNLLIKIIKEAFGYLLISFIGIFFVRIDQIMVQNLLDFEQLGYFGLSNRFTDVLFIIPLIIARTIFPKMIQLSKDNQKYESFLSNLFTILVWSSVIFIIPLIYLGNIIIDTYFFDSLYRSSFDVFIIYIWVLIPYMFHQLTFRHLLIKEKIKSNLLRFIYAIFISFLLNWILIPIYGINGAALSTLISFTFLGIFADLFSRNTTSLFYLKIKSLNPLNYYFAINEIKR
jgi:O-antigen/teichoic acid export membrane protein